MQQKEKKIITSSVTLMNKILILSNSASRSRSGEFGKPSDLLAVEANGNAFCE